MLVVLILGAHCDNESKLEGTARFAGLILALALASVQGFFTLWAEKELFILFFAYFRPFLVFSSSLSNFK